MRKSLVRLALAVVFCLCVSCGREDEDCFMIPYSPVAPSLDGLLTSAVWDAIPPVVGFHAPWDGLDDETVFKCMVTDDLFLFRFDIQDTTLALKGDFTNEMDVSPEDRAEIFFSHAGELDKYIGAEMDPAGHVLDYTCELYRQFDYDWNFSTLDYCHEIRPEGYSIAGSVSLEELAEFGVDVGNGFLMGVFRADFRPDGSVNWYSLKLTDDKKADFHQPSVFFRAKADKEPFFKMRGAVLSVEDLESTSWPEIAKRNGINTIGTHVTPSQVSDFMRLEKGGVFLQECERMGIYVEHQLHAMGDLLPRDLFAEDSTMFRMNGDGKRMADFNCCAHSEKALETISSRAAQFAAALPATNHRYYFWLDDNSEPCCCPLCREYSASEQALMIENRMLESIRKVDPEATLAHLAYQRTMEPPVKVKPSDGIFLEFAPIERQWDRPLSDLDAPGRKGRMSHRRVMELLDANLKVFPAETAVALEYWLDVSLASDWKKPAVQLPWHPEVFAQDLEVYKSRGIRNVTSFAVYMDSTYFNTYPDQECLRDYGTILGLCR
ncbi:MAG: DUF4838 domain-containing protein [Bacteroidales bacterium]|nr:DUF4838 domain-containing protein [Bacteroidales bacterium]